MKAKTTLKRFIASLQKLLILFLLLWATKGTSQTVDTSVASAINNVFSLLEKNRIPHDILLDYGFDFIDATAFDGVLRSDNYMSIGNYKELYNTMVSSCTASGVTGIASPSLEYDEWRTLQEQENELNKTTTTASVILSGLLYNYSKFNENALSNNKITIVSGKYDDKYIGGIWQNPYDEELTFAVASPSLVINKANVKVALPTTLWHSNASISNIHIDFGNGTGYKNINNGTIATTTYNTVGDYTWTYRVQLTNGQYKYCRQKVKVAQIDTSSQSKTASCGTPDIVEITATKAYQGIYGSATLQIAYGSNDCKLRKPLIVAEGLDTGLLAQAGSIGDTDISTFFQSVNLSSSIELRNLITNNTSIDYDIVYVNWDNGTDYIQRNAYVLEAVIDYVNTTKATNGSTEENVVLGQSMGGLIARYALRDMENNSDDHDTSLYISHDAPHQGAHLPLGLLYMARHAVDQFIDTGLGDFEIPVGDTGNVSLGSLENLLEAPAVQQMVINNVTSGFSHTTTAHDAWQTELETMGYPQQTRNIALSNANHCAEPQGLSSNELLVDFSFEGNTSGLSDLLLFVTGGGAIVGDIFNDTTTFLLGFLPGNTKLDAEFKVNAYPASGTARVYKGKITYEKTLLWLVPITRTITDRSYNSPNGVKFLDNYPGGVNPVGFDFADGEYIDNIFYDLDYSFSFNPNFNFISATSALDVGSGNATLFESDYLEVYTAIDPPLGNKAIPFDNFTTSYNTSTVNEPHITFNRRNGDWLAEELDADTTVDIFDCSFVCDVTEITGSDYLCSSGGTYSVPSGADTVTWSFSPSNAAQITSGQGTNTVTLAINSGYNNSFTLTAYLTSGAAKCNATNTITKTIWAGNPKIPASLTGPTVVNTGALVNYKSGTSQGAATYKWLLPYPFGVSNPIDYFSQNWQMAPTTGINLTAMTGYGQNAGLVQVMGENSCGCSGAKTLYVQHGSGGGGGIPIANDGTTEIGIPFNYFKVYPNPSSKVVFINLLNENDKPEKGAKVYGELYDLYGNLKQRVYMKNNKAMLNVTRLVSGIYVLHIYVGNTVENHKIIVK